MIQKKKNSMNNHRNIHKCISGDCIIGNKIHLAVAEHAAHVYRKVEQKYALHLLIQ